MIQEFLAFKYQGLRRVDEILAKPDDLGWKCRKYIKWREVHNSKTDAKVLYEFADDLVEKGQLKLELFGQISSVCLNVQKWRLDKENLALEPPHRKEWAKCDILFKAAKPNPAIISSRLSEHRIDIDGLSSLLLQIFFYVCEIDAFFQIQKIKTYPIEPISKSLYKSGNDDHCQTLFARFEHAYRSVGINLKKPKDASGLIQQIMDNLGFGEVTFDPAIQIPKNIGSNEPDCLLELVALEKFTLLEVVASGKINRVQLNANHPFVKSIAVNGNLSDEMATFFKSYANCMLRMPGALDTLETFNSHLGLALHELKS